MGQTEKPFQGVFGNTVELRLLEHLLSLPRVDFTVTELNRISEVSRPMVDKTVKKFLDWKIIRRAGKRGNMPIYALNEDGILVQSIYSMNDAITQEMYPELFEGPEAPFAGPCVMIEDVKQISNANDLTLSTQFRPIRINAGNEAQRVDFGTIGC